MSPPTRAPPAPATAAARRQRHARRAQPPSPRRIPRHARRARGAYGPRAAAARTQPPGIITSAPPCPPVGGGSRPPWGISPRRATGRAHGGDGVAIGCRGHGRAWPGGRLGLPPRPGQRPRLDRSARGPARTLGPPPSCRADDENPHHPRAPIRHRASRHARTRRRCRGRPRPRRSLASVLVPLRRGRKEGENSVQDPHRPGVAAFMRIGQRRRHSRGRRLDRVCGLVGKT